MQKGSHTNAKKWFRLARLIDTKEEEPYLGEAISSLKLGQVKHALKVLRSSPLLHKSKKKSQASLPNPQNDYLIDSDELDDEESVIMSEHEASNTNIDLKGSNKSTSIQQLESDDQQASVGVLSQAKQVIDVKAQFQFLQSICYKRNL